MIDVDVEEAIQRIKNHKSIQSIVLIDAEGKVFRSGYGSDQKGEAENIAKYIPILAHKARSLVRDLDPSNDLSFLRIKTKLNEILIAPDKDFLIIVIQGPKKQGDDDA